MSGKYGFLTFAVSLSLFVPVHAGTRSSQAAPGIDVESIWRNAVGLYASESSEFTETVSDTLDELRSWRQRVLRDRFEEKIRRLEVVLSKSNTDVLAELEKYVAANGLESLDDSLMMRLSQLHFDRANFDLTEKMKKYESEMSLFQSGKIKTVPTLPAPDYKKTIMYTSEILLRFPSSPLSDRAHYLLAYCLYDQGETQKAAKIYERLLKFHPYSELASESRWRLAENYFDNGDYDKALVHYKTLVDAKGPFSQKAAYKVGATLFATGKYDEAAQIFTELFKSSSEKISLGDPESATLYDESIDYLAHLKAKNVILKIDEDTDALVTERLSSAYKRINDRESSRKTYLAFVSSRSYSKSSPRFMTNVINSYLDEDELDKAQALRDRFIRALGPESSFWVKYKDDVSVTVEAQDLYETHVLASAEFYADRARKTKKSGDYEAAIDYYTKFINEYPYSPLRTEARFELAELEYFAGKYNLANSSYLAVLNAPDGFDYKEEASYGFLLSEAKRIGFPLQATEVPQPARDAEGLLKPGSPLTDPEKEFMKAAEIYVNASGDGSRKQKVLYRVAEVYFKHNQFDKVRQSLEMLLKQKVTSEISSNAVRLIALTFDLENNWEKVTETNRRLITSAPSADPRAAGIDTTIRAGSQGLLEAWHLENNGNYSEAANKFEQYSIYFPRASDTAFALYHAGLLYSETAQIASSNRLFARLTKEFPDSKYVVESEFFRAANEESLLKFEEAATRYETFGKNHPTHFLSSQAFLNAATLRRAMGQFERSGDLFREYNRRVPDDEILFQTAALYRKGNAPDKAIEIYSRYASGKFGRDLFIRGLAERAFAYTEQKIRNYEKAHQDCRVVAAAGERYQKSLSATSLQALSECLYVESLAERDSLMNISESKDGQLLEQKIDKLFKHYSLVQSTKNNDWIAASMADAGLVLDHLATLSSPGSPEKSKEFEKKAVVFLKKAYELSASTSSRQLSEKAETVLRKLSPDILALSGDLTFWPSTLHSTKRISVRWPTDSDPLKLSFDSENWTQLETSASKQINDSPAGYVYSVKARAEAELGKWSTARGTLAECAEKLSDENCIANLLHLGYSGPDEKKYRDIIETALKSESHPDWKVGLAQLAARQNRIRDAFQLLQSAIAEDPKYAPGYSLMANLFLEARRPELSRIVLDEGIKNTESDEQLLIEKGHLAISLNLLNQSRVIADEFQDSQSRTGIVSVFLARNLLAQGKEKEALDTLASGAKSSVDNSDLVLASFYQALKRNDLKTSEGMMNEISELSKESAAASYVLGIYLQYFKNDVASGKVYFSQAKREGLWGRDLDMALSNSHGEREPTGDINK